MAPSVHVEDVIGKRNRGGNLFLVIFGHTLNERSGCIYEPNYNYRA